MPKRLNPDQSKPFQPLASEFLRSVIDEAPAPATSTAVAEPADSEFEPPAAAEPPRAQDRTQAERIVTFRGKGRGAARREPQPVAVPEPGERLNRPLKVQLAPTERIEVSRIINQLSQELGTPVSASHVTRALLAIFRNAEGNVLERARATGPLKRPPNDDLTAIAAFEFRLAKLLSAALREAPALRE